MPIRIRAKTDGFRRGGMAHSSEWVEHPVEAFSPEQLLLILKEPMLQVEIPGVDIQKVKARLEAEIVPAVLRTKQWSAEEIEKFKGLLRNAPYAVIEAVPESKADARLKELQNTIQQQSDRIIELEKLLDDAANSALASATKMAAMADEIVRLKALIPGSGQEAAPEAKADKKAK